MSLAFLSKKRWNPTNTKVSYVQKRLFAQNREQVWLREKREDEEKKKIAELRKQTEENRKRDELRRLQSGSTEEEYFVCFACFDIRDD